MTIAARADMKMDGNEINKHVHMMSLFHWHVDKYKT